MPDSELKDITSIPYFAYEPGLYDWLILGILCTLAALLIRYLKIRKAGSGSFQALDKAMAELNKIAASEIKNPRQTAYSASITARRLAAYIKDPQISSLSQSELSEFAKSAKDSFSPVLLAIIELENIKYRPDLNPEITTSAVHGVISALKKYREDSTVQ